MLHANTYIAYTYSRITAVCAGLVYFCIGFILFALQLDANPGMRARYGLSELLLIMIASYFLAEYTAKGKLSLEPGEGTIVIKWLKQILFHSAPDRAIPCSTIKSYTYTNRQLSGSLIRLEFTDGTKLKLHEKMLPWVRAKDFRQLFDDIAHQYDSGISAPLHSGANGAPTFSQLTARPVITAVDIHVGIAAHRKISMFLLITVVSLFYWGYLGLVVMLAGIDEHEPALTCLSALGYFMGFFNYYRYFQNCPKVRLAHDKISFGKHTYYWDDVEAVALTGKQPFKYLGSTPMEGMMLRFKDGKERYLFDSMYANLWQVKSFVREVMQTKKEYARWTEEKTGNDEITTILPVQPKAPQIPRSTYTKDITQQHFAYFKGSFFLSMNAFLVWPVLGALVWGMVEINDAAATFFMSIAGILWFLLFSRRMSYYGVSEHYLVIKNQYLPWKKTLYSFDDVQEIRLDSPGNAGYTLNVVRADFKEKMYIGSSLNTRDWYALKTALTSNGVAVKDENYFEEQKSKGMKKASNIMITYLVMYVVIFIGTGVAIGFANVPERTKVILKIIWVVAMFAAVFTIRPLIRKLGAMAERIDNKDKPL